MIFLHIATYITSIKSHSPSICSNILRLKLINNSAKELKVSDLTIVVNTLGKYDSSSEQHPGAFAKFLKECSIVLHYIMPGSPTINNVAEK